MQLSPESSKVLVDLLRVLAGVSEERKVWSLSLRALAGHFGATSGAVFVYRRSCDDLNKVRSLARGEAWDEHTLLEFYHNRRPELARNTIMAPLRSGGRVIGVLALARECPFERGVGKEATEMLRIIGLWSGGRRELAEHRAGFATARALFRGVPSKDVAYRILHQLRRFIDHDHGATVVGIEGKGAGRVFARQVAWTKGKSDVVGRVFPFAWEEVLLGENPVILSPGTSGLWDSLGRLKEEGSPGKQSIMMGLLVSEDRLLGLVEVSSRRPDFFLQDDIIKLGRFLPYLAWCMKDFARNTGGRHG